MEFVYEITLEDLFRFGEHVYRSSPAIKRAKRVQCILWPVFFCAWGTYYYWDYRTIDFPLVFIASQAILSALFLPRWLDRMVLKTVYRQFITQPQKSDVGTVRLFIDSDNIKEISSSGETVRQWSAVRKLEESEKDLYLFIDANRAFVIPRHSFRGRDYDQLRELVLNYSKKDISR